MLLLLAYLRLPRRTACLQYEGEIHVTIIATGFSQTFEDNLWGSKTSTVSPNVVCLHTAFVCVAGPNCRRWMRACGDHSRAAFLARRIPASAARRC